jgi:hypothetical protein
LYRDNFTLHYYLEVAENVSITGLLKFTLQGSKLLNGISDVWVESLVMKTKKKTNSMA